MQAYGIMVWYGMVWYGMVSAKMPYKYCSKLKYHTALVINMSSGMSQNVLWYVCTDFPLVSVTNLVRIYRLSYCLCHQSGTYVPTFLLSQSPIWYVCNDFPIVSVTYLIRMYRLSFCLCHQSGTYVPTFLLSQSPI